MKCGGRAVTRLAIVACLLLGLAARVAAQGTDTMMSMNGSMAGPLGIPMSRDGSGTAWQPDSSPVHAFHRMTGPWTLMLHGNAFLQYARDGGPRGHEQLGATDWIMGMARREAAGGFLSLRAMMSTDALTVGRCGYPDLLATGETCHGAALHDRQHPHDLFMELAAMYDRQLANGLAAELYAGPGGEPALGPVAYPHRTSAMSDPIAPIGHHWFDATHISFGVVTAGLYGKRWKLEGSVFNGREPDEQRYDIDLGPLDSYSGRIWLLPTPQWALQVSVGQLNHVEQLAPEETITRSTASATYHRLTAQGGFWATTLMWGRNAATDHSTDALLLESSLNIADRRTFFGRIEMVQKSGADLALGVPALDSTIFTVSKFSIGYEQRVAAWGGVDVGMGVRGSLAVDPGAVAPYYGGQHPAGFTVQLSVRPKGAPGQQHHAMQMHGREMKM